jgi:hypothetical protein
MDADDDASANVLPSLGPRLGDNRWCASHAFGHRQCSRWHNHWSNNQTVGKYYSASSSPLNVKNRTGRYKVISIIGALSASTAYTLMLIRWHGHTSFLESLYIIPGGFGNGIALCTSFSYSNNAPVKRETGSCL